MKTLFYYIAGILFILLRGIALIFAGIYHLWQLLRYQVQCSRYPPPPGGMYGNMARAYKNRPDTPHKPNN
ncbi:MAG: hypothetical protein IJW17_00855 [Lentisphaeria bacterium]|nr:hypothetical protein [Lentisphaeria bacterium]